MLDRKTIEAPGGCRADRPAPPRLLRAVRWSAASIVEGINNTIRVIKRRAYGYRDQEYFFLKSALPSPAIRDEPFFGSLRTMRHA
jgi:hypothetical protein